MLEIVFATKNPGKIREINEILSKWPVSLKPLPADTRMPEETGLTYEDNALIKARHVAGLTGCVSFADDSGIEIDALDGGPGVHSARYLGEDTDYLIKNAKILELVDKKRRSARYVCAIACCFPDGREFTVRANWEGEIATIPSGQGGFGYDPIFLLPELGKTAADISSDEKNRISHRAKALIGMMELLKEKNII